MTKMPWIVGKPKNAEYRPEEDTPCSHAQVEENKELPPWVSFRIRYCKSDAFKDTPRAKCLFTNQHLHDCAWYTPVKEKKKE